MSIYRQTYENSICDTALTYRTCRKTHCVYFACAKTKIPFQSKRRIHSWGSTRKGVTGVALSLSQTLSPY